MRSVLIWAVAAIGAAAQPAEWGKLVSQSDVLSRNGNYLDAAGSYESALRLAAAFAPDDRRIPAILNKLAMTYHDLGRFSDAIPLYRRALGCVERWRGKNTEEYTALLNNLSALYVEQGQYAKAEPLIRQALAIGENLFQPGDQRLAKARSILADILVSRADYGEAERLLSQVVRIFEKQPDAKRDLGTALNNLGLVHRFRKRPDESRRSLEAALAIMESEAGPDHPALAKVLNNLAAAYADLGLRDQAGAAYRRSIQIAGARLGGEHPEYAVMLRNYARFLRDTGHKSQAKSLEARSRSVFRDGARRNGAGMTVDVSAFRR